MVIHVINEIEGIARALASAAQDVYDSWNQIDGVDEYYGTGGICDDIAEEMANIIRRKLGYDAYSNYNQYDTHTSVVVIGNRDEEWMVKVDIHPSNYEVGYGYTWQKIDGVRLSERDVSVEDFSDFYHELN